MLASTSITLPTLSKVPAFLALAATPKALISDLNCDLIATLIFNIFSKLEVIRVSKPGRGKALGSTPSLTFANCAMLAASAVLFALQPFFLAALAKSIITCSEELLLPIAAPISSVIRCAATSSNKLAGSLDKGIAFLITAPLGLIPCSSISAAPIFVSLIIFAASTPVPFPSAIFCIAPLVLAVSASGASKYLTFIVGI